jgi:acyl transferase domain-containing protein
MKANAGHSEPAAGFSGLLKLAIGLARGDAAPNAQLRALNPHLGGTLRGVSCALPVQLGGLAYEADVGGVSSFGYSGTLAHAVLRDTASSGPSPATLPALHYRRRTFLWRESSHPFVQRVVKPSSDASLIFQSPTSGALRALVADHVVQNRIIFPGAGYLEVARAAGAKALRGTYFLKPLAIEAVGLLVECAVSDGRFEVRTSEADTLEGGSVHCSGATMSTDNIWHIDHALLRGGACNQTVDVGGLYNGFDAVGLQYGPGYRTLMHAWGGDGLAAARLRARATQERTQVHPADLDDALCVGGLVMSNNNGETRLPFAVDEARLQGAHGMLWAVRRFSR